MSTDAPKKVAESKPGNVSVPVKASSVELPVWKEWMRDNVFLGMEPTPEIVAIVTIYFVEGALALARLAKTYLLKDALHLGPAEMSALSGLFVLPWTIKPLYGFLSDGFPLFGYKRKSYLILAGLLGSLSYAVLGQEGLWDGVDTSATIPGTVAALLLGSACIAMSDVVVDGIVVTRTREDPVKAGSLQSLCWGSAAIGGLLSAYYSGSLLEIMSVRDVFGITAVLPLLVALIATQMDEQKAEPAGNDVVQETKEQLGALWTALSEPSIWRPVLFLFLWRSTPTSDGAFFYFLSNEVGIGPEFLGRIGLASAGASLLGVWLYNTFLKTKNIKDILYWSTIVSFPLGMFPILLITHVNQSLGIDDKALIFGDDVVLSILGEVSFLPTLVLAARLCPPGIEAVLFASLMSVNNLSGTLGTEFGALLTKVMGVTETNFDNLAYLFTICNLSSLYPLFFIGLLNDVGDVSEDEIEREQRQEKPKG